MGASMEGGLNAHIGRRRSLWIGVSAILFVATVPLGAAQAVDPERPTCVSFQTEARFRIGYDLLVHITNQCNRAVDCTVRTNVNPSNISARVAPKTTETVLTFRGSPANTFRAEVHCDWAG